MMNMQIAIAVLKKGRTEQLTKYLNSEQCINPLIILQYVM